jgi:hypothetical protein
VIGRIALRRERYELRASSKRELRATSSERARAGGDRDDRKHRRWLIARCGSGLFCVTDVADAR